MDEEKEDDVFCFHSLKVGYKLFDGNHYVGEVEVGFHSLKVGYKRGTMARPGNQAGKKFSFLKGRI